MEELHLTVKNPFEMDYNKSTKELTLSYVEMTGRKVVLHFASPEAHALSTLMYDAVKMVGPLGELTTRQLN